MFRYLILSLIVVSGAIAAETPPPPNAEIQQGPIRVATRNLEPFAFDKDTRWTGFAAELWEAVAKEIGVDFEVEVVETAQDIVDRVKGGKAQVGVGALSITAEREKVIDFSQPFYETGLQIVALRESQNPVQTLGAIAANFLTWEVLGVLALLIVAMFGISHLIWNFEHRINREMWPAQYAEGMRESLWWTTSTLISGGADRTPVGFGGRIIAIIWMLSSTVLISLLTATITTTLTINTLKGSINGPDDLPGKAVATMKGSSSVNWLRKRGVEVKSMETIAECFDALQKKDVDAVVFDAPVLQYQLRNSPSKDLALVGGIFDPTNYGFALEANSPLRDPINQALLTLHENGFTQSLREKYFGQAD